VTLRIESRVTRQLLRIHLVALAIAVRDRSKLAHVRHQHFVPRLLQLLADPDRMRSSFHRDPSAWQIGKPLVDSGRRRSEPPAVDYFTILVERAVITPDISKVDPDRHLGL
jgi:hypothetical protein